MKTRLLIGLSFIIYHLSFGSVAAQTIDTTRVEQLGEVVVKAVKGQRNAPFAINNIKKRDLQEFSKTGCELPFLFAQTPGVLAWSENGLGTGTTYMRIRGAAGSRINVTLDGVPLNSPEDQCVFWANMNSYGSLLGNVQIQRGVGSSTNGDGAFGGTISMETALPQLTPGGEVSFSYGSYNTMNWGGQFSTGLFWDRLILEGAYHQTTTDGFIHGTSGRSGSYYGGLTYTVSDNFLIRYKNIGNFERTGQAWNGVTAGTNDLSIMDGTYGSKTGIKTYADMWDKGLGRYNSLYEQLIINEDGTYTTERYKMSDGSYWDKTTDNFWQNHNLLSTAWTINDHWSTSASLHYTYGYGYYEEFRPSNKLSKFGLSMTDTDGNKIKRTDFVRKKGLTQHTYGFVANANYKDQRWDIIGGLCVQNFDGNHFGYLTYAAHPEVRQHLIWLTHPEINGPSADLDVNYKYYDSDAHKFDGNVFVKALTHLNDQLDIFGDVQLRQVNYKTDGINDKFYDDASGYYNQPLDINKHYTFLNPKAGFSYTFNTPQSPLTNHRIYGSIAMSHREPERNNYTDNGSYPAPKAEQLLDYELGYTYNSDDIRFGANLYYMDYKDQFVQTGAQSDIGENLTTNIPDSYRFGVEMQLGLDVTDWLTLEANTAISRNRLKDFDEVVEDWDADDGIRTIHYDDAPLAFSPSYITNAFVNFHYQGLQAVWHTGMVSRQYLDNTGNSSRSLPSYEVSNVSLSYTLKGAEKSWFREMVFNMSLNNIFNKRYATSGWVYSAIYESGGHPNDNRYYQIGFIPAAGFTLQGGVTVKF